MRPSRPWLGLLVGSTVACGAGAGEAPVELPAAPSMVLPAAVDGAPTLPGPAPRHRTFDAVAMNRRCEGCHEAIAEEWRSSLHRRSNTEPAYRRQFAVEPFPFCTRCHAPEAEPERADATEAGDLGVGCVTCHVVQDHVVGVRATSSAPHPVTRPFDLRGPDGCGGCHEFAFPSRIFAEAGMLMQSTTTEHTKSAFAAQPCADCHMPRRVGPDGRRHADHRFLASRDEETVRSAVVIEPLGWNGTTWRLQLEPGRVGHAFPTGDMLRQLTLTVVVRDAEGQVVAAVERILKRHFEHRRRPHQAPRLHQVRDDRVGGDDAPGVLELPLARPPGGSLSYRLTYDRVADPRASDGDGRYDARITLVDEVVALPLE